MDRVDQLLCRLTKIRIFYFNFETSFGILSPLSYSTPDSTTFLRDRVKYLNIERTELRHLLRFGQGKGIFIPHSNDVIRLNFFSRNWRQHLWTDLEVSSRSLQWSAKSWIVLLWTSIFRTFGTGYRDPTVSHRTPGQHHQRKNEVNCHCCRSPMTGVSKLSPKVVLSNFPTHALSSSYIL